MRVHHCRVQANESTRNRIIRAAERLFAEHGISAVSLREINRAAGAKNAVAVQYHFDDRSGIVRAILAKHMPTIHAARNAMLDEYEASGADDVRSLAGALVRPWAAKLADPNGGPEFLQIYAELINVRQPPADERGAPPDDSIQRWRLMVEPFLREDAARLHRRFTVMRFAAAELGRRASTGPHTDDRLFVSHLIDLVTALLLAPTSDETTRWADERDASLRGTSPAAPQRKRAVGL